MLFFEKLKQLQTLVLGMNQRNLGLIYPNNPRRNYKYADDKCLAKNILYDHGVACPVTYATIDSIGGIEDAWESLKEWDELVIKPARGAGGRGIMILKRKENNWFNKGQVIWEEEIFVHIANIIFGIYSFGDSDVALIEEYVNPHPVFHDIFPEGVPDIRIILLKSTPLMAMLRMPTRESGGKANLHQGGLGIGIDLTSGRLLEAFNGKLHIDHHPDTKSVIKGRSLPFWPKLLALAIKASKSFPLNYLGVDLVIDHLKGPMVMEVNVRPGLGIQLANRQGLKDIIQKAKIQNNENI